MNRRHRNYGSCKHYGNGNRRMQKIMMTMIIMMAIVRILACIMVMVSILVSVMAMVSIMASIRAMAIMMATVSLMVMVSRKYDVPWHKHYGCGYVNGYPQR